MAALEAARQPAEPARPAPAAHCDTPTADFASGGAAASECGPEGQGAGPGEVPLSEQVLALEATVVAADTALKGAKAAHKAAAKALDAAEREQRAAQSRLQLCSVERHAQHQGSLLPGLAGEIGSSLQRAYAKLWRRQFREGLRDMRGAVAHLLAALRGIAQRGSDAVADLGSLQRLAHAAADPLIAVGRVAGRLFAGSVGSTTAAALMGGLGVLRLGMGVVKLGMQVRGGPRCALLRCAAPCRRPCRAARLAQTSRPPAHSLVQLMLFLALLYYLLAARGDPLLAAVGVLPVSEHGRQRAAVALNRALGGAWRGRGRRRHGSPA